MADCACDFCNHEHDCPYAYDASFCTVDRIKAAKAVVDADFSAFHKRLMAQNEQLDDDQIDCLIGAMNQIHADSELSLPDWAIASIHQTEKEAKFFSILDAGSGLYLTNLVEEADILTGLSFGKANNREFLYKRSRAEAILKKLNDTVPGYDFVIVEEE